jgi:hypothetical protein
VNYVWISHQHPDHLNFPTLKSIPVEQRRRMTVLFHRHASPRVCKVLEGMGYTNVRELKLEHWIALHGGISVICGSVGSMDSWIAFRVGDVTILNLNDCVVSRGHLAHVSKLVGKITVLFTQFSFANWIGNHADETDAVGHKLRDMQYRVDYLKPEYTVPFASFVYFCNQENSWMNEFVITPRRIVELGLPGVNFMYPEDEWDSNIRTFRTSEAVDRYMADIVRPKPIDPTPPPVAITNIVETANRMLRFVRSRFGSILTRHIQPFRIYLHDLDRILVVNARDGCEARQADEQSRRESRYVMCSQVAWYAFAYTWGWGAMEVSGMYLDRRWQQPNRLVFHLNALSNEFLDIRGARQAARTLEFMWGKRHELMSRFAHRLLRSTNRHDGFVARQWLAREDGRSGPQQAA